MSWISNGFKMIQQFFRSIRGTILVSLMAGHALVLKKILIFFTTYRWIDRGQTLSDKKKNSGALKLLGK